MAAHGLSVARYAGVAGAPASGRCSTRPDRASTGASTGRRW